MSGKTGLNSRMVFYGENHGFPNFGIGNGSGGGGIPFWGWPKDGGKGMLREFAFEVGKIHDPNGSRDLRMTPKVRPPRKHIQTIIKALAYFSKVGEINARAGIRRGKPSVNPQTEGQYPWWLEAPQVSDTRLQTKILARGILDQNGREDFG